MDRAATSRRAARRGEPIARSEGARQPPPVSGSASYRVAHVDHTIAEASVVKQLEVASYTPGQRRLATAHEHGAHEQDALVDQPVPDHRCSRPSPTSP